MLTDIFLNRYVDVPLWTEFEERDRRFLVQAFRIVEEEVYPYYVDGTISEAAKQKWEAIHARLSTELGLRELTPRYYSFDTTWNGKPLTRSGAWEWNKVCEGFVCAGFDGSVPVDEFMKVRMSFFEIALRELFEEVRESEERLRRALDPMSGHKDGPRQGSRSSITMRAASANWLRNRIGELQQRYRSAVDQFNVRLRQASFPLDYHNGFIQVAKDGVTSSEIEEPFWGFVSDPLWRSIDEDMKEALDRRDTGRRDAAFYAARALEGTIKIVSEQKGWTHGSERGAHGFVDNLAKDGRYLAAWESKTLKLIFSDVRNLFAHAPGSGEMPELSEAQTDWVVESCMSWIKSLIRRL